VVHAIRDIRPGDYLYMDYAQTEDVLFKQFPCSCGSENCRGWITGRREQITGYISDNLTDFPANKIIG